MRKRVRLKDIGVFKGGLTYSPDNICEQEKGILVLRSSNIQDSKISLEDNVYVDCSVSKEMLVRKGDLLICSRNGSANLVGKTAQIEADLYATWGAFMMVFRTLHNPRYAYYLLNHSITKNKGLFGTSTINQLTNSMLGNIFVNFEIDDAEQIKIANYLDNKISNIDAYVSERKKERLLLSDLKKAKVAEIVTKGLSTNVRLKDSGIPSIGMIPAHWEVRRIKDIASEIFMGITPVYEYEAENSNYILGQRNNQLEGITFEGVKFAKDSFFAQRQEYEFLKYGDVLLNTLGGGSVGRAGYYNLDNSKRVITDGHIMVIRSKTYNTKYLYFYLLSIKEQLENMAIGSTNQSFFNISDIRIIPIVVPPIEEQIQIVEYLDHECDQIEKKCALIDEQIQQLQLLKRALINEVVTGKKAI